MVILGGFAGAAYDTSHEPEESVHDTGLKVPPAPLSLNWMVPVGVVGEAEESVTVMVNVFDALGFTVKELGETARVVGSGVDAEVELLLVNTRLPLSAYAESMERPANDDSRRHAVSINLFGKCFLCVGIWFFT